VINKEFWVSLMCVGILVFKADAYAEILWPQSENFYAGSGNPPPSQRMLVPNALPIYYGHALPPQSYAQPVNYVQTVTPIYGVPNMITNQMPAMPSIPAMNLSTPSMSMPNWNSLPVPSNMSMPSWNSLPVPSNMSMPSWNSLPVPSNMSMPNWNSLPVPSNMSMPNWNSMPMPSNMMPFGTNGFNSMPFIFGN